MSEALNHPKAAEDRFQAQLQGDPSGAFDYSFTVVIEVTTEGDVGPNDC